ncbi:MAG: DUF615 domain-containing protein [Xanthomonadaceae bacterium]|nr:DUF615 domain-containing protein [Xanthomonadaceae bacterium]
MEPDSKSQRKREMLALQALGERLVDLPEAQLEHMDLPADLREAVDAARAITARGGRKRQLQYIGKLMRNVDPVPIRDAFARLDGSDRAEQAKLHRAESWRARLLDDGDAVLSELLDACPGADRQHLRRLTRDAAAERAANRPPKLQRELFRALRELFDRAM